MNRYKRYSPEFRERAVRLVIEHKDKYPSEWAALTSIAEKAGCSTETLRNELRRAEVDQNYEAFQGMLAELMESDAGRFALLHNRQLAACFDTNRDALQTGQKLFEGKPFSIQQITRKSVNLGYFSHARILGAV